MEPPDLTTPRLEAWRSATQAPLDLLALVTIWLTLLPFTPGVETRSWAWLVGRVGLSLVFGVDVVVRARLSARPSRYPAAHPVAVAAVLVPTVRILFSLRLLRSMFAKGALAHFLFVALLLMMNGVVLVYAFETNTPGANIHTVGQTVWWACVTVATVGYGDYYPISLGGRITAVALMALGLVSAAVITAQIASSFMEQAAARRAALADAAPTGLRARVRADRFPDPVVATADPAASREESLHDRLDRIEALLRDRADQSGETAGSD